MIYIYAADFGIVAQIQFGSGMTSVFKIKKFNTPAILIIFFNAVKTAFRIGAALVCSYQLSWPAAGRPSISKSGSIACPAIDPPDDFSQNVRGLNGASKFLCPASRSASGRAIYAPARLLQGIVG